MNALANQNKRKNKLKNKTPVQPSQPKVNIIYLISNFHMKRGWAAKYAYAGYAICTT